LTPAQIQSSCQLLADVANSDKDLEVNDGSKDLNVPDALKHILNRPPETASTSDGVLRVSTEKAEGSRATFISPDWGDKRTWYQQSTPHINIALYDMGDGYTFAIDPDGYHPMVDNFHGRYSDEDFLRTKDGFVPRAQVYVDGYSMEEQDPHYGVGGDYVIDYSKGWVTFFHQPEGSPTIDYFSPDTSMWIVRPNPGKKLKLVRAEVQFSRNSRLNDSVVFQVVGNVEAFAPHLVNNPFPPGTKIPLANPTIYKTMMDYINESNGALPNIPKTEHPSPCWRDLLDDIVTFPWDYQTLTLLSSAGGMEIHISLQHEEEFDGHATATLYCISYDE
jgi:hypothetical protein